jgi:hypothetical protein
MTRRGAMNARYQKNTAPAGKTKRSASAAKPKREAGAQGPAIKKKSAAKPRLRDALKPIVPDTPEIKRWNNIRWGIIGAVLVVALFAVLAPIARTDNVVKFVTLAVYLILLGAAFYIDFAIVRKLRLAAAAEAKNKSKKS